MESCFKEPTPVQYSAAGVKKHHYLRFEKGVRLHWHDRMELIRLHSGRLQVGYGDCTQVLEPGQIYIVPPKTPHSLALLCQTVEYDVLMFDVRSFYNDTEVCRSSLPGVFDGRAGFAMTTADASAVAAFDALFAVCEEDTLEAVCGVYRLLDRLFACALTGYADAPRGDGVIRDAIAYLHENYHLDITTEQLAARCDYSTAHFCRKFKETAWLTPMNYLRVLRLEEAARLLKQDAASVAEVAAACGFPDANYFTRCFKKHFGAPPSRYDR